MRRFMSRRWRRYATTAVIAVAPIAIVSVYATNLLVPTEPLPRPVSYQVVPTTAIENTNNTIGVADSDMWGLSNEDGSIDTAAIDKHLDELQSLGVDTVRVLIPWAGVQPIDPNSPPPFDNYFDWSRSDYIVNAAAARGMAVLGVLNSTPAWGADPDVDGWGVGAAPDPAKFAEYASLVAQRYAGKVSAYEVWNEPNAIPYWTPQPDPTSYTEVLKAAYTAIKTADPNALVVGGVLGAVVNFGNITMDARDYLEAMYAAGAKGYFDALSFHPYQYTTKFSEGVYTPATPWNADSPLEQLIAMRQMMIDNGDEALKIWATEYGLPTAGVNGVTEQQQADFIRDFLDAWDDQTYTGPAFIYTTVDRMDGTEDGSFGIFTKDADGNWVPKLAAQVIKDAIAANQPPPGGDLGTAIGQALAQLYQQLFQAVAQAYVQALSQALANLFAGIFNPAPAAASATALSLPADQQAAIAEGTTAAALTVAPTTAEPAAEAKAASAATAELEPAEATATPVEAAVSAAATEVAATTETTPAAATEATAAKPTTVTEPTATTKPAETTTATGQTEEQTTSTEEQTTSTETSSSSDASTSDPKASEPPKGTTPARKESDDEAKKGSDNKKSDDNKDAAGATLGGKHAQETVKNGTSVDEIKTKLDKETKAESTAPAATSTGTGAAA